MSGNNECEVVQLCNCVWNWLIEVMVFIKLRFRVCSCNVFNFQFIFNSSYIYPTTRKNLFKICFQLTFNFVFLLLNFWWIVIHMFVLVESEQNHADKHQTFSCFGSCFLCSKYSNICHLLQLYVLIINIFLGNLWKIWAGNYS